MACLRRQLRKTAPGRLRAAAAAASSTSASASPGPARIVRQRLQRRLRAPRDLLVHQLEHAVVGLNAGEA